MKITHGNQIEAIQYDNGGEYISNQMRGYLECRRMQQKATTPRNPYQNGVSERKNQTLIKLVRSLLYH